MRGVLLIVVAACAPQHPRAMPTADAIVRAMVSTYEHARTYADSGIETKVFSGSPPRSSIDSFYTAFVRSDGFRFYDHGEFGTHVVWQSAGRFHIYRGNAIEDGSVEQVRVSKIPRLLFGGVIEVEQLRLAGVDSIDGHACWRVVGRAHDDDLTLWIDQSGSVLRQTSLHEHFPAKIQSGPYDVDTTTHYEPVLDEPIVAERLAGPDPATIPAPSSDPWIGVLLDATGTQITRVLAGTPAEQAGLHAGDRILAVDGVPLTNRDMLSARVGQLTLGAIVSLVLVRDGAPRTVAVVVGDRRDFLKLRDSLRGHPAPMLAPELVGHTVVLAFLPSTFELCKGCPSPIELLDGLQTVYGPRGLRVVAISDEPAAILQQVHRRFPFVHDDGERFADAYHIEYPGEAVIIDAHGIVQWQLPSTEGIEDLVERTLP